MFFASKNSDCKRPAGVVSCTCMSKHGSIATGQGRAAGVACKDHAVAHNCTLTNLCDCNWAALVVSCFYVATAVHAVGAKAR